MAFEVTADKSSPVSGAVVLTAAGMTLAGLLGVTFWMDGHGDRPPWGAIKLAVEDTTSPYSITWSASIEKNGEHRIRAVARYASSVEVSSDLILTVTNPEHYTGLRYVSASDGNDADDGLTPATAWLTINKAATTLVAGQTAYFRGTFNNQTLFPSNNGTAAEPIMFKKEPGQSWAITNTEVALSFNAGANHIIIDGATWSYTANPNPLDAMKFFSTSKMALRNYTINRNYIIYLDTCTDSRFLDGTQNESGDQPPGNGGDSIFVGSGSSRNLFDGLVNTKGGHSTILLGGGFAGDALILDNSVRNCVFDNPWAQPILLQWKAERTLIEHCIGKNGGRDNAGAGSQNGIEIYCSRNIVRYCEFFDNRWSAIQLQAFTGVGLNMDAHENEIYHNVGHSNGDFTQSSWGINFVEFNGRTIRNNKIYNNIFFENDGYFDTVNRFQIGLLTPWTPGDLMTNEVRNNIFIRTTGVTGGKVVLQQGTPDTLYTLAEFDSTYALASDNVEADPLFVNKVSNDYHLQAGSPAIDTGIVITNYPYSGLAPDMGEFEVEAAGAGRGVIHRLGRLVKV